MIPGLHLISDRWICPLDRFPDVARRTVEQGVDAVHLRERDLPASELLRHVDALSRALDESAVVIVNDRVDVAVIAGAGGVQLPETGLAPAAVRQRFGESLLIGSSVHDVSGARRAEESGADFVIAGHVYQTQSKAGQPGRGIGFLEAICSSISVPVIAIGGVTPDRVAEVVAAGAWGIAVISGILRAPDPGQATAKYREALERARERGRACA